MQNPFKINKSFRVRHKILEFLFNDWEENNRTDRIVGSIIIATKTKIPIADIHLWQNPLIEKGEITVSDNDGQAMLSIQLNGRNAYIERKYLKEGTKEKWDSIWDWARILIPLGALILSIINFVSNRNQNERIKSLEQKIFPKK